MRRFIDNTNNKTKWINRAIKGSPAIYEWANNITLAEINRTTNENINP